MKAALKLVCLLSCCCFTELRPSGVDPLSGFSGLDQRAKTAAGVAIDKAPVKAGEDAGKAIISPMVIAEDGTTVTITVTVKVAKAVASVQSGIQNGIAPGAAESKPGTESKDTKDGKGAEHNATNDAKETTDKLKPVGDSSTSAIQPKTNIPLVGEKANSDKPVQEAVAKDTPKTDEKPKNGAKDTGASPSTGENAVSPAKPGTENEVDKVKSKGVDPAATSGAGDKKIVVATESAGNATVKSTEENTAKEAAAKIKSIGDSTTSGIQSITNIAKAGDVSSASEKPGTDNAATDKPKVDAKVAATGLGNSGALESNHVSEAAS